MRKPLYFCIFFTTIVTLLLFTGCKQTDNKPVTEVSSTTSTVSESETTATNSSEKVTKDKAEDIALKDAGFSRENATVKTIEKDTEDGKEVYKIEFEANGYEYDYVIDTATGVVTQATREQKNTSATSATFRETVSPNGSITLEEAKKIAINHAGTPEGAVTFTKSKLDTDNGVKIYEIDFSAGNMEYEYNIDATTGKIISFDKDNDKVSATTSGSSNQTSLLIPSSQAVRIALVDAGVRESDAKIQPVDLDAENGVQYYDVTFRANNIEYEYEINAETGEIISADKD